MKRLLSLGLTLFSWCMFAQSSVTFTWIKGDSTVFPASVYGTEGVTASSNVRGGRNGAAAAINSKGELYAFGGYGNTTTAGSGAADNEWADLWKWDGTDWTWVGGSNVVGESGNYGTKGIAAPTNLPTRRWAGTAWFDDEDNFYVFGGLNSVSLVFNDLWKWDGTNWTWLSGDSSPGASANYGVKGVPSSTTTPGASFNSQSWVDADGNLFLYGGVDASNNRYDDVWKFDTKTEQWTWVHGSGTANTTPNYGSLNTASASNTPGARSSGSSFDVIGNDFFLYGGETSLGRHQDMWKWDGEYWTWVDGSKTYEQSTYNPTTGAQGVPSRYTNPAGIVNTIYGVDPRTGDFWIFGGRTYDSYLTKAALWRYDGENWTWEGGSTTDGFIGKFGTKGTGTSTTFPTAREDYGSSRLLFGENTINLMSGSLYATTGVLNDVWRVDITPAPVVQTVDNSMIFTWVKGDSTLYPASNYGTKGVTSASNTPGGRQGSSSAVDSEGNLYFFGGYGNNTLSGSANENNYLADLWKWDGTNWTWVAGSSAAYELGTYGTKGVAAASNKPSKRWGSVSWFDNEDNFYVFGGSHSFGFELNDLWKWDGTNWTWLSGESSANFPASYGTKGVASATTTPGGLKNAHSWTDANGNLYLYGGEDQNGNKYDDVWMFNTTTNQWMWVHGSGTTNLSPNYGSQNVASLTNTPGGRMLGASFDASKSDFFLYGGKSAQGRHTDMWKWDGTQWTWVDGSKIVEVSDYNPIRGNRAEANPYNTPAGVIGTITGVDPNSGDFWMFGGEHINAVSNSAELWRYDGSDWIWEGGNTTTSYSGKFGTLGTGTSSTLPTARLDRGSSRLRITDGGQIDLALGGNPGGMNNVWRVGRKSAPYSGSASGNFTWVGGDSLRFRTTNYGEMGSPSPYNQIGARYAGASAINSKGELYYYAGYGNGPNAGSGLVQELSELWKWDGENWTWLSGNSSFTAGTYGTKGVASPTNAPPYRYGGMAWFDNQDNFYFFGGATTAHFNDLWKWDGTNWTWLSGSQTSEAAAVYGTKGVSSASNTPGALSNAYTWVDDAGNLYLFGGANSTGFYDDIWMFNTTTNQWTWVHGSGAAGASPSYGTLNVAATSNTPGGRHGGASFDVSGDEFFLYGGSSPLGRRMDMWKWDGTNWTWVDGAQSYEQSSYNAVRGTRGVPDAANTPAGLMLMQYGVQSTTGDFWMYGGRAQGTHDVKASLWRYNGTDWIWEGGNTGSGYFGRYEALGSGSSTTYPPSKKHGGSSVLYFDENDETILYLGSLAGEFEYMNDMWHYGVTNQYNGQWWSLGGVGNDKINAQIISDGSPGDFKCMNLYVAPEATLTVSKGDTIEIYGNLTCEGAIKGTGVLMFSKQGVSQLRGAIEFEGSIIVNSGNILNTNDQLTMTASSSSSYGTLLGVGTVEGMVTAQTWLDLTGGADDGRYFHLGSPFIGSTFIDFNEGSNVMVSSNTVDGTTWEWNAASAEWTAAGAGNLNTNMTVGKGYAIYAGSVSSVNTDFLISDAGTVDLQGTTTTGVDQWVLLNYNNGQGSSIGFAGGTDVASTQGWNFAANPFLADYDWQGQGFTPNLSTAKYVWNGSIWEVYNNGVGNGDRYIAPFQGFMVQYTSDPGAVWAMPMSNSNTVPHSNTELNKQSQIQHIDGVDLIVRTQQSDIEDQVYIGFDPQSTVEYDSQFDARKLKNAPGVPNIFAHRGTENYSITRVPYHSTTSFNVAVEHDNDGDAMIIRADLSKLMKSPYRNVILEDLKTGAKHDLEQGDYTYSHDSNYNGGRRFILHFMASGLSIEDITSSTPEAFAWNTENTIEIQTGSEELESQIELYNISGQHIASTHGNGQVSLPMPSTVSGGVYLLHVTTAQGSHTIKIIR